MYIRHEGNMLDFLRKYNPKHFYKLFNNYRKNNINILSGDSLIRSLVESPVDDNYNVSTENISAVYEISLEEISNAINKLKSNKSCDEDYILN